ncbi:cytochrome c oxidase cbb3-type subunit I/II [Neorhodopirellula lusitana]|uniref:cytochrome-c oxidase n=1 Tax=Neorhodopirellula lusitana TaxID=445327 RepID=A0ABY1PZW0_9BACT|nr:cytochrome c oxidase cbb3-type subunit I/II [Neorhodopirellula lusitana]
MATMTSTKHPQPGGTSSGGTGSAGSGDAGQMEQFSYDDTIVRLFATATIVWGIVATLAGLTVAVLLVMPGLSGGLDWLNFARLRPLHTNAAIFAFAGNAIFAAIYYSTQRLCKTRMWSDALSQMHFWGWQLIIVLAALTLPFGITQSKEYAELEWPIDILIAVVWLFIFGGNFLMTLINRRERHMYVALWFYIATIVTVALLHVFNNLVVPIGLFASIPIYAGVQDAFMQWWYGHNAVAFFLTTPFLGLMYYFLPKAADRPVFSYRLSIIHFWSLVFIYIWAGPHHLHYTALPEWASTLGMLFSVMLWMPSWGGMINGLLTLRGAWHKVAADPVLKFFVVGITFYGMSTFEGPALSVKAINAFTHYTDWTIAHVHSGALGWNGFMSFGMLYWLLPRLYQTKLWSPKLMSLHFWTGTIGILLYIIPIYAAGLMQGWMWRAMDDTGHLMYPDFIETTQSIVPLWWLRVVGGILYVSGALMMGINALMTWKNRPSTYEVPVISAPRLTKEYVSQEPAPKSHLEDVPVLELGKKLDIFGRMGWHRRWERLPVKFTVLVTLAVVVATLSELIPTFLIRTNVPTIATVKPYTPLELAGRHIFVSEGCYNCHSQMIRPMVSETKRYGEYSKPGEFIYDRPFQWGSRRIGPDLAREGGKQSSFWHWTHFENPENVSPGSVMPSYGHLLTEDMKYDAIAPHVKAAAYLGAEYTDEELNNTAEVAQKQAEYIAADIVQQGGPAKTYEKQAIALIAYLQRVGVDLFAEEAPAEPAGDADSDPESTEADPDVALNEASVTPVASSLHALNSSLDESNS